MQLPFTNQNQGDFEPATQVSSVLLLANQSEKDISHITYQSCKTSDSCCQFLACKCFDVYVTTNYFYGRNFMV